MSLGDTDALSSELRGIAEGLNLAWDKGFRRVILESDSKKALDLIRDDDVKGNPMEYIVRQIESLWNRNWTIKLSWCFRESNDAATWLAGAALGKGSGLRVLMEPPLLLEPILMRDLGPGRKRR